ncbi:MAG: hypothetical protein AVDCRST_MAG59-2318 [uncultured Thermomicrobiales bacterium]|jgi:hypothetical protein|uniref:Uncharacterized protein n=1 Tax=uncultured Thermomicrobiales bacterium TaxID=1645740 RepID=A0A6J4UXH0_9BACT|nr:MAG: hypothetical protein AVDCRST_MAG59-2318 [uncultured Thermomicrobiales bacterium]
MTVRIGRRIALTFRLEFLESPAARVPAPPLGADDAELARWSAEPAVDLERARWTALTLIHGGGSTS